MGIFMGYVSFREGTKKNPGMDTIGGWQHLEPPEIVFESLGVGPKLCGQNLKILRNLQENYNTPLEHTPRQSP